MSDDNPTLRDRLVKEAALFFGLLFLGMVLLPAAIFYVGQSVFGEYAGGGYGGFFGDLSRKLRAFDWVAWFLVLSPYLAWQCLRLTALLWRLVGRSRQVSDPGT